MPDWKIVGTSSMVVLNQLPQSWPRHPQPLFSNRCQFILRRMVDFAMPCAAHIVENCPATPG